MIIRTIFIVITIFLATPVYADVLYNENLDGYADKTAAIAGVWGGATDGLVTLEEGAECRGGSGKCWKINWTEARSIDAPLLVINKPQIYVRFYMKQSGSNYHSKTLKFHGGETSSGYSNTTVTNGYTGAVINAAVTGNGAGLNNDNVCAYRYYSAEDGCLGDCVVGTYTADYSATGGVPISSDWHCYEFYAKQSSDEGGDGAIAFWYDGTLVYSVDCITNRNSANDYFYSHITLGDYTQYTSFIQYYDDIVVADEYIGPLDYAPSGAATIRASGTVNWR